MILQQRTGQNKEFSEFNYRIIAKRSRSTRESSRRCSRRIGPRSTFYSPLGRLIDWWIYTANGNKPSASLVASATGAGHTLLGTYGLWQLSIADIAISDLTLPAGDYFAVLSDESMATDYSHVPNWYFANSGTGGSVLDYHGSYYYGSFSPLTLEVVGAAAPVPEPASLALFVTALVGLGMRRRHAPR